MGVAAVFIVDVSGFVTVGARRTVHVASMIVVVGSMGRFCCWLGEHFAQPFRVGFPILRRHPLALARCNGDLENRALFNG